MPPFRARAKHKTRVSAKAKAKKKAAKLKKLEPYEFTSEAALSSVKKWAWSGKSAVEVQADALRNYNDQCNLLTRLGMSTDYADQDLADLAGLGARGKSPGNCKAGLTRMIGTPTVPGPDYIDVPMQILKPKQGEEEVRKVKMAVLTPHKQVANLYQDHPDRFSNMFFGGGTRVRWRRFGPKSKRGGTLV